MQYSKVEICGVDTSKLTVLKEKEKIELLKAMHNGDKTARDKLKSKIFNLCRSDDYRGSTQIFEG